MSTFEESYLGQLRKLVGDRRLITPGVRAVIQDRSARILFLRRRDSGRWDMPAGGIELGESVYDSLRREVGEETGIEVRRARLIAVHSGPLFAFTDAFGGRRQMLDFVFRVDEWTGEIDVGREESVDSRFVAPDQIPDLYAAPGEGEIIEAIVNIETLDDLRRFTGDVILK